MNSSVYLGKDFWHLVELLCRLRVISTTRHMITYAAKMTTRIPSHWIHLPVVATDLNAHYIEILPARKNVE